MDGVPPERGSGQPRRVYHRVRCMPPRGGVSLKMAGTPIMVGDISILVAGIPTSVASTQQM